MSAPTCSPLSPSSLSLFLSCQRKYWHKKIGDTPIDPDTEEDTEALKVGKAFHKVLEECMHELAGVSYQKVFSTVADHELVADEFAPMIFAMLGKYKAMHEKSGLKAIACEIEVRTETFLGYVDVVLVDKEGGFWLGDNKTSAAYYSNIAASLPRNPQLNLYAGHASQIATLLGLDINNFRGCRYMVTTKSKLIRKKTEELEDYLKRLSNSVKSVDFVIPIERMAPLDFRRTHLEALDFIRSERRETRYSQNFGNCNQYFRSCAFFSRCHGACHSQIHLESISADD